MKKILLLITIMMVRIITYAQIPYRTECLQKHELIYMKTPRNVYENTKSAIARAMLQWQSKGEFEKQVNYENRIAKQSKRAFDSIVVSQMMNTLYDETDWYCYPLQYDAENESFKIEFINEDVTLTYTMDVKMDVEFAKKVRMYTDEFDNIHSALGYKGIQKYIAVNLVDDWKDVVELEGHFLFKKIIMRLKDRTRMVFDFPVPDTQSVVFYADDMGLDNLAIEGYACEFSKVFDQWKKYYID